MRIFPLHWWIPETLLLTSSKLNHWRQPKCRTTRLWVRIHTRPIWVGYFPLQRRNSQSPGQSHCPTAAHRHLKHISSHCQTAHPGLPIRSSLPFPTAPPLLSNQDPSHHHLSFSVQSQGLHLCEDMPTRSYGFTISSRAVHILMLCLMPPRLIERDGQLPIRM